MRDLDPFGPAGGARGVNLVGEVLGADPGNPRGGRQRSGGARSGVDRYRPDREALQARQPAAVGSPGQQNPGGVAPKGVFQHERQPILRIAQIEGDVSAAGLERCQQGHDHVG